MFGHAHRVGAVQWHWKKSSKWRFFSEEKQSIWELLLISVTLPIHGKTAAAEQQARDCVVAESGFHVYTIHSIHICVLDTYCIPGIFVYLIRTMHIRSNRVSTSRVNVCSFMSGWSKWHSQYQLVFILVVRLLHPPLRHFSHIQHSGLYTHWW